jgi:hypothetical protein
MEGESPTLVSIGGVSKEELRHRLAEASVSLNPYAELLFDASEFTVSDRVRPIDLVSVSLEDLGLDAGGTLPAIFERADGLGYELCPLEVAPHLRLHFLDQSAGPYLTVASPRPRPHDMDFPAGFYLRRLDDGLWLRGYRTDDDWVFPPAFTRFVFSLPARP